MKYIKVFTDFANALEALGDAECGRLFRAMLRYAETGNAPDLRGNERFVWPTAKGNIDRDGESYARICERNRQNRSRQLPPAVTSRHQPPRLAQDQDKDQDQDQDQVLPGGSTARAAPPAVPAVAPPTVEEVEAYCRERRSAVDPRRFVDFYAARGWMAGSTPIRDWRAALRVWEQRERPRPDTAAAPGELSPALIAHFMRGEEL